MFAPQAMGLGDTVCARLRCEELLPPLIPGWIMVDLPARLPKTCLRLSTHDLSPRSKVGVLRRVRENVEKSGHVGGLGSSLVLNPSRESKTIGYVDNSGRLQIGEFAVFYCLTARGGSVF